MTSSRSCARRFRRFVFPMTALFLVWYFLYVLLAAYAPDFMAHQGRRQHQRRPDLRPAAVRLDVRDHDWSTSAGPTASSTRRPTQLREPDRRR